VFTKFAAVLALYLSIVVRLAGMAAGRRRRKRMKFVHTADWQIGLCATQAGNAGERIRQERLKAAERVVAATRDAGAEFGSIRSGKRRTSTFCARPSRSMSALPSFIPAP
jgi:hypothetical protein